MGGRGGASHRGINAIFGRMPSFASFHSFPTQADANQWHTQNNFNSVKWQNDLTQSEQRGIREYTGSSYIEMNTNLRHGTLPSAEIQEYIDGATEGLSKWSSAEDMMTYRGANLHWTANLLGGTENQMSNAAFLQSRIGKMVTDKGFMSTGTHINSAWTNDVTYTIFARKGISGMYVDPISVNQGEYEFLFNRDTEFKVHMIKTDQKGRISELVLEAIGSKHKR